MELFVFLGALFHEGIVVFLLLKELVKEHLLGVASVFVLPLVGVEVFVFESFEFVKFYNFIIHLYVQPKGEYTRNNAASQLPIWLKYSMKTGFLIHWSFFVCILE